MSFNTKSITDLRKNYIVMDVETPLINKDISIAAQQQEIVLYGYKIFDMGSPEIKTLNEFKFIDYSLTKSNSKFMRVGHNIGFDILVMCKNNQSFYDSFVARQISIWDTAIVEYMLTGQSKIYPSLDHTYENYFPNKIGKNPVVSDLIKSGVCPSKIYQDSPELLSNYLIQDVEMTHDIYKAQLNHIEAMDPKFFNLVKVRMDFLRETLIMSLNGMKFDWESAMHDCNIKEVQVIALQETLETFMNSHVCRHIKKEFEPFQASSNKDVATVLYGGIINTWKNEPIGEYKTGPKKGLVKTKKVVSKTMFNGLVPKVLYTPGDSVDEASLLKIKNHPLTPSPVEGFIDAMLHYRYLNKQISTYLKPYIKMTGYCSDNRIRADFQHTSTATGRLSCTKPNLQNVSSED